MTAWSRVRGISHTWLFVGVATAYVLVIFLVFGRSKPDHSAALARASRTLCDARNAAVTKNITAMQGLRDGALREERAYRAYLRTPTITEQAKALITVSLHSAISRAESWREMIKVQQTAVVDCASLTPSGGQS